MTRHISEFSIDDIHDAASRLHAAAWYGSKGGSEIKARFSIPRQATDDDEVVYAAIVQLGQLRQAASDLRFAVLSGAGKDAVAKALVSIELALEPSSTDTKG